MHVGIFLMWHIVSHLLVSISLLAENSASTIRENVIGGVRPKISEDHSCPPGLVQLIKVCWSTRPDARPDFMGTFTHIYCDNYINKTSNEFEYHIMKMISVC